MYKTPAKIKLFYDDMYESMKAIYQLELPNFYVFLMEFYDLMNYSVNYDIDYMSCDIRLVKVNSKYIYKSISLYHMLQEYTKDSIFYFHRNILKERVIYI